MYLSRIGLVRISVGADVLMSECCDQRTVFDSMNEGVMLIVLVLGFWQIRSSVRVPVNIKSLRTLELSFLLRATSCILYLVSSQQSIFRFEPEPTSTHLQARDSI